MCEVKVAVFLLSTTREQQQVEIKVPGICVRIFITNNNKRLTKKVLRIHFFLLGNTTKTTTVTATATAKRRQTERESVSERVRVGELERARELFCRVQHRQDEPTNTQFKLLLIFSPHL